MQRRKVESEGMTRRRDGKDELPACGMGSLS
jgi:hypothetical protein